MPGLTHCGTREIHTARLLLRLYRSEDAQDVFALWAGDARVTDQLDWTAHRDVAITQNLVDMWAESYASPTVYRWCIEYQGRAAGDIAVCRWNQDDEWCELGYCLSSAYWGQGLMTEALSAVCGYLFNEVGFHRIQLRHEAANVASGRVMQKCGFQYEGTMRHAKRGRDGEWKDICCYARLKND